MIKTISSSVRPIMTYFIVVVYMIASTYAAIMNKIEWSLWFAQVGTMAVSIISYWFGERSVSKQGEEK